MKNCSRNHGLFSGNYCPVCEERKRVREYGNPAKVKLDIFVRAKNVKKGVPKPHKYFKKVLKGITGTYNQNPVDKRRVYRCIECGHSSYATFGKCPVCGVFSSARLRRR